LPRTQPAWAVPEIGKVSRSAKTIKPVLVKTALAACTSISRNRGPKWADGRAGWKRRETPDEIFFRRRFRAGHPACALRHVYVYQRTEDLPL